MVKYYCENCRIDVEKSECPICGKRTKVTSSLYWCKSCNVPIYDEVCPICGSLGDSFTSDVRPVFPEERLLIEVVLGKPLAYLNDSVWNGAGNRYYVNGKKLSLSISSLKKLDVGVIRQQLDAYKDFNSYDGFNSTMSKWVEANRTHFDFIVTEAMQFIRDYSRRYINDDVNAAFVSFSGGKDSTVVSDLGILPWNFRLHMSISSGFVRQTGERRCSEQRILSKISSACVRCLALRAAC